MEPTPHHHRATAASAVMVKCALAALLLSGVIGRCSAACNRHPLMHVISHEGCAPRTVPAFGCRGTCTSYARVSPVDYTRLERSCQCCQESDHQTRRVRLHCPSLYPSTRAVELKWVSACNCRPCHGVSGVAAETRLEQLRQ